MKPIEIFLFPFIALNVMLVNVHSAKLCYLFEKNKFFKKENLNPC